MGFISGVISGLTNLNNITNGGVVSAVGSTVADLKGKKPEEPIIGKAPTEKKPNENEVNQEEISGIKQELETAKQETSTNYEEILKKLWEREDTIRKETQEREDTAYQRAVKDMKAAGINPNLVGINPANSGGGITTASSVYGTQPQAMQNATNVYQTELNNEINKYIAELNNMVKKGVATQDNITSVINNIIGVVGNFMGGMMRG